ncbi:hypothetical protein FB451DRAFT_1408694 [Mycena latifolia]|nr:hypothetical protein FB451DRAFT_1408694 [Mycena latifolia]
MPNDASQDQATRDLNVVINRLADAQDNAFKREVMRHADFPLDHTLSRWLDRYMAAPPAPRPPGPSYSQRLSTSLVARKARVDALMALRARGEKHARRWPRLRQAAEQDQKARRDAETKRRQDIAAREAAAREALVRKKEREAADARVAVLMRQRAARGPRYQFTTFGLRRVN